MRIRLEVARSHSYYWPWFLRAAKKNGGHSVKRAGGLELHTVEIPGEEAALLLWHIVRSWKGVSWSVDGREVTVPRFNHMMWEAERRPRRAREMMDAIIRKKALERRDG